MVIIAAAAARSYSSTFVTALHKQQTQFRGRKKKKHPATVNPLQRIMSVCLPVCRSASMCWGEKRKMGEMSCFCLPGRYEEDEK